MLKIRYSIFGNRLSVTQFRFMKLIFIGATGLLGKPVAKELLRRGICKLIFGRDPEKIRAVIGDSFTAEVIYGDVFNKSSLVKAFEGMDTVYINLSILRSSGKSQPQPEREGINNIVDAAKESGITRIVYLSSLIQRYQGMNGFNWWAFDIKHKAVEKIKSSGLQYSIFYPSSFMDTFEQLIKGNKLMLANGSKVPNWFISATDYANQVGNALEKSGPVNQEYVVQGPEALNWEEASQIVIDNYHRKLKPLRMGLGIMRFLGNFNNTLNYGANILTALYNYPERFESEITWRELGEPKITMADYARSLK